MRNASNNSNFSILGKLGSGMAYTVKMLLLNEYTQNKKIIIIDPECEYNKIQKSREGNDR